jgi:hypothetical protein
LVQMLLGSAHYRLRYESDKLKSLVLKPYPLTLAMAPRTCGRWCDVVQRRTISSSGAETDPGTPPHLRGVYTDCSWGGHGGTSPQWLPGLPRCSCTNLHVPDVAQPRWRAPGTQLAPCMEQQRRIHGVMTTARSRFVLRAALVLRDCADVGRGSHLSSQHHGRRPAGQPHT